MAKKYGRDRVCLAVEEKMVLKSNYYTVGQLDRLARVAKETDLTESFMLREALDYIIDKYETKVQKKIENLKKGEELKLNDLPRLSDKAIQKVVKEIDNQSFVYIMLKADKDFKECVNRNMSERAVKLYGADVEEARAKKISADQIKNAQGKMIEIQTT